VYLSTNVEAGPTHWYLFGSLPRLEEGRWLASR